MLVLLCGKMGAGKTTKSKELAKEMGAVLLSEDIWLESLYPAQIRSVEDYVKYSNMIKPLVKSLVQNVLSTGSDVVMDFPANTIGQRGWLKSIFTEIGADHELIYIKAPNEICLNQIAKRRIEQPERAATDTQEMFVQITKYFVEPSPDEGFNVTVIEHNY
ncbi:AAA family ATPase [Hahella sp. NBU794]|uniref:AAA family ATPase n=1 Tax=Hahella sp. NBU794 TaxID=3422590 RepID=UPI003D70087C